MNPAVAKPELVKERAERAPALPTWQERDAEALECRADAIAGALMHLALLDGMFAEREELRSACANAADLLGVEEDNLRQKAGRLRDGKP